MDESALESMLVRAVQNLFEMQPNIFEFTSETGQTEWNLAHHLANEVHKLFPELDCDLDVVKRHYDMRRPDIILHRRGTHADNFLVIEVKKDGGSEEIAHDLRRISEQWFRDPLHYQFGAVVNLRTDGRYKLRVLRNPS